jgi:Kyanoviridae DNA primase/helicase
VFDTVLIAHLLSNKEFFKKVFPYLKKDYFSTNDTAAVYELIRDYAVRYQNYPSKETLAIELASKQGLSQDTFEAAKGIIGKSSPDPDTDFTWLVDSTESWCKKRALHNAIRSSIPILEDDTKNGGIPKLLQDALSICFDQKLGHWHFQDYKERLAWYREKTVKIPWRLRLLNRMCGGDPVSGVGGGIERQTLNCVMAPTGVGKTLFMCDEAAHHVMSGLNVVYFTLEMMDKKISHRIDSNLLSLEMSRFKDISDDEFNKRWAKLKEGHGEIVVQGYPPLTAGVNHFRAFLDDLRLKKGWEPDLIYTDYLNLSASVTAGKGVNSYERVKCVGEETRGLMVERNVAGITATQTNRSGANNSDYDMTAVSDSFGLPYILDFFFGLIATKELTELGQQMIKQLGKNRYGDSSRPAKGAIGLDKQFMRYYDLEDEAEREVEGAADVDMEGNLNVFDKTGIGEDLNKFGDIFGGD